MEPSWVVPCDLEEAAAWSDDDRSSFQASFASHSGIMSQQVVEYAAPARDDTCSNPIRVFEKAVQVFHADYLHSMEWKMHKLPPSLIDVPLRYTVPVTVAIGPYHHSDSGVLQQAEKVKHVAANQCINDSGCSVQEMYDAVFSVSHVARSLYYEDDVAMASIGDNDFLMMMFFDACFLVQFMRCYVDDNDMDAALESYFSANYERISTDILMLQNQIPWVVVQTILDLMPAPSPWVDFVTAMRSGLRNRMGGSGVVQDIDVHPTYVPPHLLGLVRFYIVGNNDDNKDPLKLPESSKPMSLSISVAELADVGIKLVPKEVNAGLVDICLRKKWPFFGVLDVPPLFLTEANATWLVNMAAFELCKTPDFEDDKIGDENSAVCSYLHLFAMLLDQEQHVHQLRENNVIEGGGLTSKEALEFFTSIGKNMRLGKCYLDIIIRIEEFKRRRSSFGLKSFLFWKKNMNRIVAVISVIGAVVGILSSLQALKPR